MAENADYIYALQDLRTSPAKAFYRGQGTGVRAWEQVANIDDTRKGKRIAEIKKHGAEGVVTILAGGLSELQALKLEAELIAGFAAEDSGGIRTNTVQPAGKTGKVPRDVTLPLGTREKAQIAFRMLNDAVLELAPSNSAVVTNSEVAKSLGLPSDYAGGSKGYLSFTVLGLLMREGKVARGDNTRYKALVR